jgi:hypothetical protein
MKKIKYLIIPALTGLLFAACSSEPKGPSEAEIDALVADKVNARVQQLAAECDARVMEMAKIQADSIVAAMSKKGGKPAPKVAKPTTPPPPKTTKPTTPNTTKEPSRTVEGGGLRSQSDQSKSKDKKAVEGGGLRSQSDQSKAKDNQAVQGGGLRSQSDQAKEKK